MDFGILLAICVVAFVLIAPVIALVRSRHATEKSEILENENASMREQLRKITVRIEVLEKAKKMSAGPTPHQRYRHWRRLSRFQPKRLQPVPLRSELKHRWKFLARRARPFLPCPWPQLRSHRLPRPNRSAHVRRPRPLSPQRMRPISLVTYSTMQRNPKLTVGRTLKKAWAQIG